MKSFFVTGIGTDVGKTVVSAVLCKALGLPYWKPVQSGELEWGDSKEVARLVNDDHFRVFPERFRLRTPASPDASAAIDGVKISLNDFDRPEEDCLIEGAGGVLVPLNESDTIRDLIVSLDVPVVVVSRHYLGSIHHTLSTIESLKVKGIEILGLVFVGDEHPSTENSIKCHSSIPVIGRIPYADSITPALVSQWASTLIDTSKFPS